MSWTKKTVSVYLFLCSTLFGVSAQKSVPFAYGNMDQWITRHIHESGIIGGNTKSLYEIGPTATIDGNTPFTNQGGSPWATSNVMAKVAGVVKTNTSVFPEKRGSGYCARLETRMESVKVARVIDITVLAAGSIFLGSVLEPIKSPKNPQGLLNSGIPFTQRPQAIKFDYKVKMAPEKHRVKATGFGSSTVVEGIDMPGVILLLQKRWEDANGNIYSKRVGTMVTYYTKDTDWNNGARYEILYGDITQHPKYKNYMRIQVEERYAVNSKGKPVPIQEVGWADADETPTHMVLQFTSSHGGAYIGAPGNTFWIDNVSLEY